MGRATTSHPPYLIFHCRMKEIPIYTDAAKGSAVGKERPVDGPIKRSHQATTKAGPTKTAVLTYGFALAKIRSPKAQ